MIFKTFFFIFCCFYIYTYDPLAASSSGLGESGEVVESDPEVKIFPVGQGNCVAVKYAKKVVLVDMGSMEHNFQHFYKQRALEKQYRFEIAKIMNPPLSRSSDTPSHDVSIAPPDFQTLPFPEASYSSSPSSDDSTQVSDKNKKQIEVSWQSVIASIKEFLSAEDIKDIVFVGSHSDQDHVGDLIGRVFYETVGASSTSSSFYEKLTHIILGGFKDEYPQEVLEKFYNKTIIYTGTYDGGGKRPQEDEHILSHSTWKLLLPQGEASNNKYARPYCSFIEEKTDTESRIEEALRFDGDKLTVQILAMNAGHSLHTHRDQQLVTVTNKNPNSNSIVLRFLRKGEEGKQSFLVPGDADYATWNYIKTMHSLFGEDLSTDYMVVSHHGSSENEATRESILRLFKPQCVIISSGRHGKYHHPNGEAVDLMRGYFHKAKIKTDAHELTYYRGVEEEQPKRMAYYYKRISTKKPIFSTVVNGEITFVLQGRTNINPVVTVSQIKPRLFINGGIQYMAVGQYITSTPHDEGLINALRREYNKIQLWVETNDSQKLDDPSNDPKNYHIIKPEREIGLSPIQPAEASSSASASTVRVQDSIVNIVRREIEKEKETLYLYYIVEPISSDTKINL